MTKVDPNTELEISQGVCHARGFKLGKLLKASENDWNCRSSFEVYLTVMELDGISDMTQANYLQNLSRKR